MEAYEKLEAEWASWNGLDPKGMVACSSGTSALHLALEALELPLGSEIVTGDMNMIAVPRAIALAGHKPVFVDCDERLLMDLNLVPSGDPQPLVVLAVHIYGRQVDLDALHAGRICGTVIEDLAEAHGLIPHKDTAAAVWSHYKNKAVHGSEGGHVWFRDPKHAEAARELRCLGFRRVHDFWHRPRGHNYRMSNEHAQLIRLSLLDADRNLEERRRIEGWYDERCPKEWRMPSRDVVWVYDLRLPLRINAIPGGPSFVEAVVGVLNDEGIAARCSFKPMHRQEEFKSCRFIEHKPDPPHLPVVPWPSSCYWSNCVLYLPVQPGVTTRESVHRAFDVIEKAVK